MERVHIHIADRFHCLKQTFVRLTFDEGFNKELHDHLGFRARRVIQRDDADHEIRQRVEYETSVKIPWVIRKLAGRSWVAYWENQAFDRGSLELATEIEPMILKGRIQSTGLMRFLDDDEPGWMQRTYDIDVAVGMPIASKLIAKQVVADVHKSYGETRVFVARYLRDNNLEGQ